MLALKFLLIAAGVLLLAAACGITLYDLWGHVAYRRKLVAGGEEMPAPEEPEPVRWRAAVGMVLVACLPLVLAQSIVVIPAGMGGVRVSQMRGTLPGTLYPGTHFITPLVESVQVFDLRDRLFTTGALEGEDKNIQPLDVQSKEGLNIGLAITVRYRLDPRRLDYIQSHLPQPVDSEHCAGGGGERVARADAELHSAGNLQLEAGRSAQRGGREHHEDAGRRTESW